MLLFTSVTADGVLHERGASKLTYGRTETPELKLKSSGGLFPFYPCLLIQQSTAVPDLANLRTKEMSRQVKKIDTKTQGMH